MKEMTYSIRRQLEPEDINYEGIGLEPSKLKKITSGLKKLHTFEGMAVNIYKYQIGSRQNEFNRMIIQAMANEMTHVQDFQIKLYEYGSKPSRLRWMMWFFGIFLGCSTRLLGEKYIVKAGIWTEQKAVVDYQKILDSVEWDVETRTIIQRNLDDEYHHIATLQSWVSNV